MLAQRWIFASLLSLPLALFSAPSLAQLPAPSSQPSLFQSRVEIGVAGFGYTYQERVNNQDFMSLGGWKAGLDGFAQWPLGRWFALRADGAWSRGFSLYRGSGEKSDVPEEEQELRSHVCWEWARVDDIFLAPCVGVGWRSLSSDLRGVTSTGAHGMRRLNELVYAPLSLNFEWPAHSSDRARFTLEWDPVVRGTQWTTLSDSDPAQADVINHQSVGNGWRASLDMDFGDWSWGLFFHSWSISKSDLQPWIKNGSVIGSMYEPDNTTVEGGLRLRRVWK